MGRWHARLAALRSHPQAASHVQSVQPVQYGSSRPTIEHIEHIEHDSDLWTEAHEEGAAIIEFDGGAPKLWAEALARLDPTSPPGDVPLKRWLRFIDDCGRFLDADWAAHAASLGWTPLHLFGCDRDRPWARIDHQGLLWLINGNRLVALGAETAIIETVSGARQTYHRSPVRPGHVVLPWELISTDLGSESETLRIGIKHRSF
jgi:hypothetical protein